MDKQIHAPSLPGSTGQPEQVVLFTFFNQTFQLKNFVEDFKDFVGVGVNHNTLKMIFISYFTLNVKYEVADHLQVLLKFGWLSA